MKRRKLWLLGAALLVLAAAGVWLIWPGHASPLALLLRQDQTWQAMQQRRTLRVGLDPSFPPFESLDDKGQPHGFDVDLAQQLAAQWGMKAEIVAIGFDSLVDALKATKVDAIVSAYPYDPRLTRDVTFSTPYFDAGLQLAVRKGSTIRTRADLAGKQVAVEWGSQGDMAGRQMQRDGIALTLVPFETPDEAVKALAARNDIDALLIDNVTLRQAQSHGVPILGVGDALDSNPYVIVTPLNSPDLQQAVESALASLKQSGSIGRLEDKWFSQKAAN